MIGTDENSKSSDIKVLLDDTEYTIDENEYKYSASWCVSIITQKLIFEKTDLENKLHTIKIYNPNNTNYLDLIAIDLPICGYLCDSDGNPVNNKNIFDKLESPDDNFTRINCDNENLLYTGNWTDITNGENNQYYYNNNAKISDTSNTAKLSFSFFGTDIRLMSKVINLLSSDICIKIDNVEYSFSEYSTYDESTIDESKYNLLVFEKRFMENKLHEIEIYNNSAIGLILIDSIDINSDGYIIPVRKIKDQLLQPDNGYQRINNTNTSILYSDNSDFSTTAVTDCYNSSLTSLVDNSTQYDAYYKFRFYGNKLRIIQSSGSKYSSNIEIFIDGVSYGYLNTYDESYECKRQTIVFDINNLDKDIHIVKIKSGTNNINHLEFDAIDINDDGYLIKERNIDDIIEYEDLYMNRKIYNNDKLIYKGNWKEVDETNTKLGKKYYSENKGDSLRLKFTGHMIRLIGNKCSNYSENVKLVIDGKEYNYSQNNSENIYNALLYEKDDLQFGNHTLSIRNTDNSPIDLNYIDIDGELIDASIKNLISYKNSNDEIIYIGLDSDDTLISGSDINNMINHSTDINNMYSKISDNQFPFKLIKIE